MSESNKVVSSVPVQYIWVDASGKVIKQKARSKGRPPKGVEAAPRADGNYYIVVSGNETNAVANA